MLTHLDDDVDGGVCDVGREGRRAAVGRVDLPGLDAVRRVRRVAVVAVAPHGVAPRLDPLRDPLPPRVQRLRRTQVLHKRVCRVIELISSF